MPLRCFTVSMVKLSRSHRVISPISAQRSALVSVLFIGANKAQPTKSGQALRNSSETEIFIFSKREIKKLMKIKEIKTIV